MSVGSMIYGGVVPEAILAWQRAGGGAGGWNAAHAYVAREYPNEHPNSVNALINRARETVELARRYNSGGAQYTPDNAQFPDMRPVERRGGVPTPFDPNNPPPARYYHEGIVEVRDARYGDTVIQRFSVTIPMSAPMSKTAFVQAMIEDAESLTGMFGRYDGVEGRLEELSYGIKLVGGYRGY